MEKAGLSPDLILVDGRFRVACFLASLLRGTPGTPILFDDYVGREERYAHVERYVKPSQPLGRTMLFEVPDGLDKGKIAMDLARFCMDKR